MKGGISVWFLSFASELDFEDEQGFYNFWLDLSCLQELAWSRTMVVTLQIFFFW
jgi:hypothetical protein